MRDTQLRSIAIVGGGVAGWMAAATLSRLLKDKFCRIVLLEWPQATALGIGEGTIPAFQRFNNLLGIDEADFIRKTNATFKLGIEFKDWWRHGQSYYHTFGAFGGAIASVPFHHYWLKLRSLGDKTPIEDYAIATAAAKLDRFMRPVEDSRSALSLFSHAYHVDAGPYAQYLREYARARGVERIDQKVVGAELRSADGYIERLVLESNQRIEADFYIDCTGFPGLLVENVLQTGYEDWSRWLPCDRAVSIVCAVDDEMPVYTRSTAREAGWQWSLPLRDRIDNGYVFSSGFVSDDEAIRTLIRNLDTKPSGVPRVSRFVNGRPKKFWNRNCLALPGGFLEPLESTNVHLIQTAILKLFATFPDRTFNRCDSDEYNRITAIEFERVRDFLILHYCLNERDDAALWKWCRSMAIPPTLRHKIDLFRSSGRVSMLDNEHFGEQSWVSLFLGHNIIPQRHDPLADGPDVEDVKGRLLGMTAMIREATQSMPRHKEFLARIGPPDRAAAR